MDFVGHWGVVIHVPVRPDPVVASDGRNDALDRMPNRMSRRKTSACASGILQLTHMLIRTNAARLAAGIDWVS